MLFDFRIGKTIITNLSIFATHRQATATSTPALARGRHSAQRSICELRSTGFFLILLLLPCFGLRHQIRANRDGEGRRDDQRGERRDRRPGGLGEPGIHLQYLPKRSPTLWLPPAVRSVFFFALSFRFDPNWLVRLGVWLSMGCLWSNDLGPEIGYMRILSPL